MIENNQKIMELEKQSQDIMAIVEKITIQGVPDYQLVENYWSQAKDLLKAFDTISKPYVKEAYDSWQKQIATQKQHQTPLNKVIEITKKKLDDWNLLQDKIAREKQAELDRKAAEEQKKLLAKAEEMRTKGKDDRADELTQKAQSVVAPIVAPTIPISDKSTTRKNWHWEVIDISKVPDYLTQKVTKDKIIDAEINSTPENQTPVIPGLKIWYTIDTVKKGGRK